MQRSPYQPYFVSLLIATSAWGCVATSHQDTATTEQLVEGLQDEPCQWSFECAANLICGRSGFCEPPPGALCSSYELQAPVFVVKDENTPSEVTWTHAEAHAYVSKVTERVAWHPGMEGSTPGNKPSVLQRAIADARDEHAQYRQLQADPSAGRTTLELYAHIHYQKQIARTFLRNTQHLFSLPSLSPLPGNLYYCQSRWHDHLRQGANAPQDSLGAYEWQYCIGAFQDLIRELQKLEGTSQAMPLEALQASIQATAASLASGGAPQQPCAEYARMVELPFALAYYGEIVTASAQNVSALDPLSDLNVNYVFSNRPQQKPLGQAAMEMLAMLQEDRAVDPLNLLNRWHAALGQALDISESHLVALENTRFVAEDIEDLAQITLLSAEFIQEHPEFAVLHHKVLAKVRADQMRLLLGNIGLGTGCAVGTGAMALGLATGPAAPAVALGALLLCGGELALAVHTAKETSHLYRMAMTFRYYGLISSLETHERVQALLSQRNIEWAFAGLTVAANLVDIAAALTLLHATALQLDAISEWSQAFRAYDVTPVPSEWYVVENLRAAAGDELRRFVTSIDGREFQDVLVAILKTDVERIRTVVRYRALRRELATKEAAKALRRIQKKLDEARTYYTRLERKSEGLHVQLQGYAPEIIAHLASFLGRHYDELRGISHIETKDILSLLGAPNEMVEAVENSLPLRTLLERVEMPVEGGWVEDLDLVRYGYDGSVRSLIASLNDRIDVDLFTRRIRTGFEDWITREQLYHVWGVETGTDALSPYYIPRTGYWTGNGVHTVESLYLLRRTFGYPIEVVARDPTTGVFKVRITRWHQGGVPNIKEKMIYPHVDPDELIKAVSRAFDQAVRDNALDLAQRLARVTLVVDGRVIPAEIRFDVLGPDQYKIATHHPPWLSDPTFNVHSPYDLFPGYPPSSPFLSP